jgi:hypothetical protein
MGKADWLDYQKLAAEIYADLERNAHVTHDEKIKGIDTGIDRQIDVAIRTTVAGHEVLIIVQAKDLRRKADVNIVGEFHSVIKDVRAAKGVLICSGGFTKSAIKYASKLNIDVCTAHDAQRRKWSAVLRIPLVWIESTADVTVEIVAEADRVNTEPISISPNPKGWLTSVDNGATRVTVGELLAAAWNANTSNHTSGTFHKLEIARSGMRLLLGDSYWIPLLSLTCEYKVEKRGWLGDVAPSSFRGIHNQATGTMRSKLTLTNRDLPLERDPKWKEASHPEELWKKSALMLRIEKMASPDSFEFRTLEMAMEN